jgi:hypothetical protein
MLHANALILRASGTIDVGMPDGPDLRLRTFRRFLSAIAALSKRALSNQTSRRKMPGRTIAHRSTIIPGRRTEGKSIGFVSVYQHYTRTTNPAASSFSSPSRRYSARNFFPPIYEPSASAPSTAL